MEKIKNYLIKYFGKYHHYLDKQTLKFIGIVSVVVLGMAVIILSAIINQQKDLSLQKSKAAETATCNVQFTITQTTLTPTPPNYITLTPTQTLTPTPPIYISLTPTLTPTLIPTKTPTLIPTKTPTVSPTRTPTPTQQSYTTRTQGYWMTHTTETSDVFANQLGGTMKIGYAPHKGYITNILQPGQSQLFGAFYSSIPKKSNGTNRTALDQARMQLLQQLVATKLNCAAFGCPTSIYTLIDRSDWDYAYGTSSQILSDASQLDNYNNSGEAYDATPGSSQLYANIVFWDAP